MATGKATGKGRPGRKKGTPKTGGRKRGTPNKTTIEAREACAQIVDDPGYRKTLIERAQNGKLAPAVETMLWHYAKGKPVERVEMSGSLNVPQMPDAELRTRLAAALAKL